MNGYQLAQWQLAQAVLADVHTTTVQSPKDEYNDGIDLEKFER